MWGGTSFREVVASRERQHVRKDTTHHSRFPLTMSEPSASVSAAASEASKVPSQYRSVGIILAVSSGVLIGSSFVFKKKGLISSQKGGPAGEGVGYLKSPLWWTGMIMMILGELCNFGAYAFVEAIVVTPLGALSVVICAILSSIFLNEKLTFFGWIGCIQCIIGSIVIALNAPEEQSVTTIAEFKKLFLAPGFLSFGSVVIVASLVVIFFVAPRYGKKSMLWYILVCSLIGGLSVSCTQGLGASIVTSIRGENQFKNWFIYFLLVFVVVTLLTEIYYLNIALALFNTAMVTPTYYVIFTFCTLVTSIILYQGLHATVTQILTVVLGFLMICTGITILQMSKVDPRKLQNLDRRTTLLLAAAREHVEPSHSRSPSRARSGSRTGGGLGDAEKQDATEDGWDACSLAETEEPGLDALRGGGFGAMGTMVRARRRSTIVRERRGTVTSQHSRFSQSSRGASEEAGHAGIGIKRFQDDAPPLPLDSAQRIEAARKGPSPTPYGPSLGSGPAGVIGDIRDEPALRMMEVGEYTNSPDESVQLRRGPSSGGVHFRDGDGRRTPEGRARSPDPRTPDRTRTMTRPSLDRARTPDPMRSGTPDPNNPGTYVLRVPAPAGSMTAVPRRVVSPSGSVQLSRTGTPTKADWKKGGTSAGTSTRADTTADGDASRIPRVSSTASSSDTKTSIRAQPAVSEYFPAIPSPGDEPTDTESQSHGLPLPVIDNRGVSGLARSDRATVADSEKSRPVVVS
ncbi:Magnesium transporter NIPA2 OS=Bos taurus GN=NIPA2 PE=2 SV=1 [Rhizoctonia solani AG-1 IB]|uniref:Magnesium transporter NIPA2 n=1 Tax=Thanatephorus cucumeris (strain AG1-IB / isolate 7/3/14) TaxID=1108050 RepID=A0A0B7G4D8_THACB|nr:Magnesium transporter NIPA2 OS=Bos taurus GN=NIPA2 PE=2 SV=1 [Rhizoctonia solani AG-1 IB]